ncbi:MAG: hypothetical protein GX044_07505 [Firmicutes bacterium]|nr:hypothetical protein [Bacillota bacterium]
MERFIDPCCERCTHTTKTPCKDFVECCVEGPLCHEDEACAAKRKALIDKVAINNKFVIC